MIGQIQSCFLRNRRGAGDRPADRGAAEGHVPLGGGCGGRVPRNQRVSQENMANLRMSLRAFYFPS